MPGGPVRFVLDDGETLTLDEGDLAQVYELCWKKLAPKGGAIELAALIRGVTRANMVGAPIDLDVRQSAAMREAVASLQAQSHPALAVQLDVIRAGVHTGECERVDGKLGGLTVHVGARIAALAQPHEILVSSVVRDLVSGSGISFDDRGIQTLKGVPDQWQLYAATAPAPQSSLRE